MHDVAGDSPAPWQAHSWCASPLTWPPSSPLLSCISEITKTRSAHRLMTTGGYRQSIIIIIIMIVLLFRVKLIFIILLQTRLHSHLFMNAQEVHVMNVSKTALAIINIIVS